MKVAVINGSPKGAYSVTLQTVRYLACIFPEDSFTTLCVGQRIHAVEQSPADVLAALAEADLLLFAYPVYTFLAPSQLHRFLALVKAAGVDLSGKAATQITTSKHFFDVTAHRYVADNCFDLGLRVIPGFSADMDDLLEQKGRRAAEAFWRGVRYRLANGIFESPPQKSAPILPYVGGVAAVEKSERYDVVVVTDLKEEDSSLAAMIRDFQAACACPVRVVNLADYPFQGGCLGCFRCAVSGKCVYTDGFDTFLRERIQTADAILYAFTICDHSMGARFKQYDDRQFCNGHRTVTAGKPTGYLINGDYASEPNLRMVVEGRASVGGNDLTGVATDAAGVSALAKAVTFSLKNQTPPQETFYGVGGMKIFRDLIYQMRGLMKADHRYYKAHGVYDFPQKQPLKILKIQLLGALISIPNVQKKLGNRMNEGMLAPYEKVIQKARGASL